ncbi:MAG: polymer-forming cytoskeletal protein [Firmicutes bacterium]|nr:polymer-forming cytoskeletal protein [Bacillota bacterium]
MDNSTDIYIHKNAQFNGNLESNGSIKISGVLVGNIKCPQNVFIDSTAKVESEITALKVTVKGIFNGKIIADKVILLENSYLEGKITSKNLIMEKGAVFIGESKKINGKIAS